MQRRETADEGLEPEKWLRACKEDLDCVPALLGLCPPRSQRAQIPTCCGWRRLPLAAAIFTIATSIVASPHHDPVHS